MSYISIFVRRASCDYVRTETGRAQHKKKKPNLSVGLPSNFKLTQRLPQRAQGHNLSEYPYQRPLRRSQLQDPAQQQASQQR